MQRQRSCDHLKRHRKDFQKNPWSLNNKAHGEAKEGREISQPKVIYCIPAGKMIMHAIKPQAFPVRLKIGWGFPLSQFFITA